MTRPMGPAARRLPLPALGLTALALLAGCFSLGRETPPLEQYVLGGVQVGAGVVGPDSAGPVLGLRRLELAPYLATADVLVREGPHRIVASEFHRWGEDLGEGINRAVAGYLRGGGGFRRIDVAPWSARTDHDYLVQLRVQRFEGVVSSRGGATAEGEAHVLVTWELLRPGAGVVVARGTTHYREGGWRAGDYAGLVLRLDRGVARVASDLADRIATLPAGP